ncbi:MAG: ribonuclease HII, partial [Actinomycetota bacterium]|nr:ribonuclease HII [Actinomycetota bacterium]
MGKADVSIRATYRTRTYGKTANGRVKRTRPCPTMQHENALRASGAELIAGVDEVGVGAWAGPLAVGVVVLRPGTRLYKVRDSKMVDAARREWLASRVRESCLSWSVGLSWPDEIDRVGLSLAQKFAAERAIAGLTCQPDAFLLDGQWNFLKWTPPGGMLLPSSSGGVEQLKGASRTVVRGDSESVSIACASLVAKVVRDELMLKLSPMYPHYRFELNKGYPSPVHKWA